MSRDVVLCAIDGGVATITWNKPERNNGWAVDLQQRYFELLDQCEADPAVRAIVVTGAGKSFCPGADMSALAASAGGESDPENDITAERPGEAPMWHPMSVGKPTIAAINGACAGLGLVQALYLDVRFAARGAKFTTAFPRRGLIAEYGAAWLLPRVIGDTRARELLISSRVVDADEALELGLVNFVSEPADVLTDAQAYAHDIAANVSTTAVAITKRQLSRAHAVSFEEAANEAVDLMRWSLEQPEFVEGVNSYIEKRRPQFKPYTGTTGDPWEGK